MSIGTSRRISTTLVVAGTLSLAGCCCPTGKASETEEDPSPPVVTVAEPKPRAETVASSDGEPNASPTPREKPAALVTTPATYPAACGEVDEKTHVKVDGAPELCIPSGQGMLVTALLAAKEIVTALPNVPGAYSDESPIAVLLGPDVSVGETAQLNATERAAVAAKTRAATYVSLSKGRGEWTYIEAAGKLTGTLDFESDRLVEGTPVIQRKQKCEAVAVGSCGRCDDDGDCSGFFCGCSESVCNPLFHVCSACPAMSGCDEPEFPMTVPPMKLSATYSDPDAQARAKRAADGGHGVLLTRVTSAWRRTFTKMEPASDPSEKPERKVEHDTGYFARISPMGYFILACDDDNCGRTATQLVAFRALPWTVTLTSGDTKVSVKCNNGICTGSVTK